VSVAVKRIGIGIDNDAQVVIDSAYSVSGKFMTVCYCRPGIVDKKTVQNAAGLIV
jgi:hypothetical protein